MANSADKTMDNYFSAVERGTQQTNDVSDVQKQLQEATYIAVDSTMDIAEAYGHLKNQIGDYGTSLEIAGEQALDSQEQLHKKIKEELNQRQKVVDYYSQLPDKLKEQIEGMDDTNEQRQENQEQEQKDEEEHRKKKKGLLKRIRANLEGNAKEGGGFAKTYGSRAILAATDGIKSLFSGLVQQIPLFNEVKAGFSKGKQVVQDINATRVRRRKAKEEKVKEKFSKKGESSLNRRERKIRDKMRKRELRNQKKMLKAQTEGNKLLEKMNKRMMLQSLFSLFGNMFKSLGSIISSGVMMGFKGLGLVSAVGGLTRLMGGLLGKGGVLGKIAKSMGISMGGATDKDKNKSKGNKKTKPKPKPDKKLGSNTKKQANNIRSKASNVAKTAGNVAKGTGSKLARMGMGAAKMVGKIGLRAIPGLGWGLLAYDAVNFATGGAADDVVSGAFDKASDAISDAVGAIGSLFGDDEEKPKAREGEPAKNKTKAKLEKQLEHYTTKYEQAMASGDVESADKYRKGMKATREQMGKIDKPREATVNTSRLTPVDAEKNGRKLEHYTTKYEKAKADGEHKKARVYKRAMEHYSRQMGGDTNVTNVNNNKNYKQFLPDNRFSSDNRYAGVQR